MVSDRLEGKRGLDGEKDVPNVVNCCPEPWNISDGVSVSAETAC